MMFLRLNILSVGWRQGGGEDKSQGCGDGVNEEALMGQAAPFYKLYWLFEPTTFIVAVLLS